MVAPGCSSNIFRQATLQLTIKNSELYTFDIPVKSSLKAEFSVVVPSNSCWYAIVESKLHFFPNDIVFQNQPQSGYQLQIIGESKCGIDKLLLEIKILPFDSKLCLENMITIKQSQASCNQKVEFFLMLKAFLEVNNTYGVTFQKWHLNSLNAILSLGVYTKNCKECNLQLLNGLKSRLLTSQNEIKPIIQQSVRPFEITKLYYESNQFCKKFICRPIVFKPSSMKPLLVDQGQVSIYHSKHIKNIISNLNLIRIRTHILHELCWIFPQNSTLISVTPMLEQKLTVARRVTLVTQDQCLVEKNEIIKLKVQSNEKETASISIDISLIVYHNLRCLGQFIYAFLSSLAKFYKTSVFDIRVLTYKQINNIVAVSLTFSKTILKKPEFFYNLVKICKNFGYKDRQTNLDLEKTLNPNFQIHLVKCTFHGSYFIQKKYLDYTEHHITLWKYFFPLFVMYLAFLILFTLICCFYRNGGSPGCTVCNSSFDSCSEKNNQSKSRVSSKVLDSEVTAKSSKVYVPFFHKAAKRFTEENIEIDRRGEKISHTHENRDSNTACQHLAILNSSNSTALEADIHQHSYIDDKSLGNQSNQINPLNRGSIRKSVNLNTLTKKRHYSEGDTLDDQLSLPKLPRGQNHLRFPEKLMANDLIRLNDKILSQRGSFLKRANQKLVFPMKLGNHTSFSSSKHCSGSISGVKQVNMSNSKNENSIATDRAGSSKVYQRSRSIDSILNKVPPRYTEVFNEETIVRKRRISSNFRKRRLFKRSQSADLFDNKYSLCTRRNSYGSTKSDILPIYQHKYPNKHNFHLKERYNPYSVTFSRGNKLSRSRTSSYSTFKNVDEDGNFLMEMKTRRHIIEKDLFMTNI